MFETAQTYLKENVDDHIAIKDWNNKKDLPLFLRKIYNFYEMKILNNQCILIEVMDDSLNIDQLKKHLKVINKGTDDPIVLLYKEITRYRRKSLIENRISFVIKDGQMYLPFLGLDLKKVPDFIEKRLKRFTTPAQVAYLYFLYHKDEVINMTTFAKKIGFNEMTASRALNELYKANLITYRVGGKTSRSKEYKRISDPEYFQYGKDYLKTPIVNVVYTKTTPQGALTAGLDALAELSMINAPKDKIMAIEKSQISKQQVKIIKDFEFIEDHQLIKLELWKYDPRLFSNKDHIDVLSLFASLKEETDERVEQALSEIMKGESWYTD